MSDCGHDHSGHSHGGHSHDPKQTAQPLLETVDESAALQSTTGAVGTLRIDSRATTDLSLPALFARAEEMFRRATDGAFDAVDSSQHVADALATMLTCAARIRTEGALSSNEEVEDMSTGKSCTKAGRLLY